MEAHIAALTRAGPRHRQNPAGISAACDYISSTLGRWGYQVAEQRYGGQRHQVNFTVELPGYSAAGFLEVGAHWDSVPPAPVPTSVQSGPIWRATFG